MHHFSKLFIVILLVCNLTACRQEKERPEIREFEPAPLTTEEIRAEVQTFPSESGWGFDVFVNEQKYVHQPYIPVIEGNYPFKTEDDAKKVGELMVQKIQGNIIPPTITLEELQVLNIDMSH